MVVSWWQKTSYKQIVLKSQWFQRKLYHLLRPDVAGELVWLFWLLKSCRHLHDCKKPAAKKWKVAHSGGAGAQTKKSQPLLTSHSGNKQGVWTVGLWSIFFFQRRGNVTIVPWHCYSFHNLWSLHTWALDPFTFWGVLHYLRRIRWCKNEM